MLFSCIIVHYLILYFSYFHIYSVYFIYYFSLVQTINNME